VKATILSLVVIIILAPVAALCLSLIPFDTGIIIGLFIVSVMPTTLSSGVVMTGTAGGNMAHALFVTIISNFVGILSIPVILSWLLSVLDFETKLDINQVAIIIKLSFLVLLPLFIGICAKIYVPYARYIPKLKLQIANQCMIIGIVFISVAGAKQVLMGKGIAFFYIVALVSVFHLILLGFSFILVRFFQIEKGRYESIIFMGSQKTLPLSVMIQVTYFSEFGIALLVCVVHHIVHLMIDGYLSTKMSSEHY
jgi:sodium/bile acid cotransporter 7